MARERRGVRIVKVAFGALPLVILLSRVTACTGRGAEIAQVSDAALLDTYVVPDVTADVPSESASDAPPDAPLQDAALAPIAIGINPTIAANGDAGDQVDQTLAEIQTLGAGSRAGSLRLRYDELFDASGVAIGSAFDRLGVTCALYAQHRATIALTAALVDRQEDARPSALRASWTSSSATDAVDALIDGVIASCGGALGYLSFGYESDRFLAGASSADRAGFAALAGHALGYARGLTNRPATSKLGVGFSLESLLGSSTSEQNDLLALGDAVFVSYLPLDATFQATPPQAALDALTSLADVFGADADARQLVLTNVGYPSSSVAGSSLDQQGAFFKALFPLLDARRERWPFVAIDGLFDRDLASCQAESALYLGPAPNPAEKDALSAALCSLGLQANAAELDGGSGASDKPAFALVLAGLSALSGPALP